MKTLFEFIEEKKIDIDKNILQTIIRLIEIDWIYVSNEIVYDHFGYKKSKDTMKDFYNRLLLKDFQENIDYKEVDKNHDVVKEYRENNKLHKGGAGHNKLHKGGAGHNKKYYIITSKTYITLLIRAKTIKAARFAEYFYVIHELLIKYYKYQSEYLLTDFKDDIQKLCELPHIKEYTKLQEIKYLDLELYQKNKIGVVYFIHEKDDLTMFKIGFTADLKTRLGCLQISNLRELIVYKTIYATDPSILESIIHKYLKDKNLRGEWFEIDTNTINEICDDLNDDD